MKLKLAVELGGVWIASVAVASAATFFITSTGDEPDANPGDGMCQTALTNCTLRAAIQEANAQGGTNSINAQTFGPANTIDLTQDLPPLLHPVVVDGFVTGTRRLEINGHGFAGLDVRGGNSTIRRWVINRCSTAVALRDKGHNTVDFCLIGTDTNGTVALLNTGDGILLVDSPNNRIGGEFAEAYNVISGNLGNGIHLTGGSSNTTIRGNLIGLNGAGNGALGNAGHGIHIADGGRANTISGLASTNVISGNGGHGILIEGVSQRFNLISRCLIGTDVSGTLDLGNTLSGVRLSSAANNTLTKNVVSGNGTGVEIVGPTATLNQVIDNWIGTDMSGTLQLGNDTDGVGIDDDASGNFIGNENVIAFNGEAGVHLFSGTNNLVRGNVHSNGGLGIDLGPAGVTANDMDCEPPSRAGGFPR